MNGIALVLLPQFRKNYPKHIHLRDQLEPIYWRVLYKKGGRCPGKPGPTMHFSTGNLFP